MAGGRFLDIGGGTGRYTLPLLQLTGTSGVAHDICPLARRPPIRHNRVRLRQ